MKSEQSCAKCGETRFYVIDFHHKDPSNKLFTISDGRKTHKSNVDVLTEVKKCVCLCRNCHKEFHYFYGVKSEHPIEDLEEYFSSNPSKYSSMQDIIDKEYTLPFTTNGRKIVKIGANIQRKTRNLERWIVEE